MQSEAIHAFFPVFIGTVLCTLITFKGVFDENLGVGTGREEYAEKPDPIIYGPKLIEDLKFPANAFVNVLYTVIGTYWFMKSLLNDPASKLDVGQQSGVFYRRTCGDAYMTSVFAWMGIIYGPYQFLRITTQSHRFAVLDQWFTFPFFSWVMCWTIHSLHENCNWIYFLLIETISLGSYFLTLYSLHAFDVILVLHILFAVGGAIYLLHKYPNRGLTIDFVCAIFCTCGFVFLKLGDHYLASLHPFFSILSGHFWSKIFDSLQIHFVCRLFEKFNYVDYRRIAKKNN